MVKEKVKKILLKDYPLEFDILGNEHLYIDLGMDSLGFLSLILDLEKCFDISIDIDEYEDCLYFENLVEIINKKIINGGIQ